MTTQHDCTLSTALLEQIASQGLDALPDLMRTIINADMEAERQQHLGVGRYERSPERRGYANGFTPKTMTTRVGEVTFADPQVRDGSFYPSALERGLRSERALTLAEMYVQGVSTRRVAAITEQLCGVELSSSQKRTCDRAARPHFGAVADPPAWRDRVSVSRRPLRNGATGWPGARCGGADCHRGGPGWPTPSAGGVRIAERAGGSLAAIPARLGGPWLVWRAAGDQRCVTQRVPRL